MPFSSGTYSLPSGNPVVTGTTISSSTTNTTNSDIATALSTCVLKDGTQTITANLPMASHKLTGLSAGTTAGDSVEYGGSPSFTNLAYTGTLTGSTGVLNIGSGQVYKDASGNVGIGTSSPSTKLTVAGAITITGAFALRGSYGAGAITTNFAAGDGALGANTTGNYNTASGMQALHSNTTGKYNTASGMQVLFSNTTGVQNTASGQGALQANTTGNYNTASGMQALYSNITGNNNTASGQAALYYNTTGSNNTANGTQALYNNTTGSGNSAFNPLNSGGGYAPVFNPTTENNRFCMGSTGVTNAYIQVAWTVVSDARDKTNFAPVPHGLDFVNQLQPTAYQFKEDRGTDVATGIVRYGFKAQDILALEGDSPVIIDTEDLDKLRFNSDSLIPVLVNAIKELTARLELLEGK